MKLKFNKKNIISSIVLIASISVSALSTYKIKANSDDLTLTQVKQELDAKDKELEDKIDEGNTKDKQIEELNNKVANQENTINQLNSSLQELNQGLSNTNAALDNAKKVQKEDKKEVVKHADDGDKKIQKQVDTVKEKQNQPTKTEASGEAPSKEGNKQG